MIPPGETVPNDYYVRNETKRQLTYTVPRSARVTVVTNEFLSGVQSTRIAVSELAAIVKGRNPRNRKLYGRPASGSGFGSPATARPGSTSSTSPSRRLLGERPR